MFGMGWPNFISVLSCALILANPVCRGAVWTAEDQARALSQGRGRLPSAKLDTSKAKIWTKLDETRAKNTGQGRLRHVTSDFGVQGPKFDARKQDGAAFDDYPAKKQDRGQSPQFEGRTQGGAAQTPQHDGLTFDERKQDRGRLSSSVLPTPHVVGKIWTQEDEDRARNLGQGRLRHVTPDLGGQVPQFDGRIKDGDAYDGRTQAEIDYLDYLREQQLENEAKVKDSAAENARFDAQKPQINGRPQDFGAQITEFDGRTQAELDYLEYLRAEQQFENNPKIAKIVLTDNAKNARFDAPTPQFNGRPIDFSSPIFQIDGRTQAELDYLEYLRAEKQFENDAKIKDSATEHGRLEDQISHLDGRPQDTGAHIDGLPQAELEFLEYLRAEQQFQNDVKISQNDGRTQAELEYLEYLRAEQLENDAKIKDSAAENARIKEVEITEEPISDLRAEQLETDAKIKDSAAENARVEEVEITEEPISDEPVCLSCHLFDKKQDEKPVEVRPQKAEPERECLSCHLFDEPASDEGGLSDEPASALPLPEVDTRKSASGGFQDGDAYDGRTQAEIDYLDYLREEQLENEAKVKDSAAENARFEPASALPLPEVDTRKSASGESEGGYLQDTLDLITGIFQGEGTGRNPAPVNPRFGVHNQDINANLKAAGQTQNDGRIQDGDAYGGRTQAEIDYLDYLREEQLENEAKVKDSAAENARFGAQIPNQAELQYLEQIPSQAELQYLEYRKAEQEEELEIDGILKQLESDEILDFDFEYRQSLLDANTQESFHDRSPYENLDLPDSFNTRFGGQREDKSATAARFGAQRQDQPASFDTRHSGQRQDQPASFDTRYSGQRQDQPASFVPRQYLSASFDTRHSGSRLNQPASANFGFRGQIRDQPASGNSRFGGQSQDQYVTSNTRFRGQKQDQFPSSNTRFGGQIQRQPRIGNQPASGFGDHSDLVGSNIDAQKKIDAEFLAYEAELAEQRAAQTAYEAELAKQRASQKAYEDELGNQRAAQTAYEDELGNHRTTQSAYEDELAKRRAAQKAYEDELGNQRAAQTAYEAELAMQHAAQKAYEDELAKQRAAQKAYEDELGNQRSAQTAYEVELSMQRAAQKAYEDELAKQRAAQKAYEAQVGNLQDELGNQRATQKAYEAELAKQRAAQKAYEDELGNQRAAQTAYEDELAKQRAAQKAYEAQVGNLQQGKVQTFEGGHRVKVAKLMDVDEEETLSAQPQRSRPKGGCRSCFLLDEF